MTEQRDKVAIDDIIGMVKTDEPTNSVELKKEMYCNMSKDKNFTIDVETETDENAFFYKDKFVCFEDDFDSILETLNMLDATIQELKQKKNDLKDLLVNSETVLEQKELQKLIYKIVRDLINEKLVEGNKNYEKQFTEAKIKNISDEKYQKEVSIILDTVFYWKGYVKALNELKDELIE